MTDSDENATSPAAAQSILDRAATIPEVRLEERAFSQLTTLHIGGAPAGVIACSSAAALSQVVTLCDEARHPWIVVGGGSNLVVGEGPEVAGLLVVLADATESPDPGTEDNMRGIEIDRKTGLVRAFAGVTWDALVRATVEAKLGGLECLSGIPGSVGATPVQNVGAYGAEVASTLTRVQLHNRDDGTLSWVSPESLELGYRYSNLKFTRRAVVTAVEFSLTTDGLSAPLRYGELARRLGVEKEEAAEGAPAARKPVEDVRAHVLELRRGKGMVLDEGDQDTWSAGSFFTNPVVCGEDARDAVVAAVAEKVGPRSAESMPMYPAAESGEPCFKFSAAWLIERAGFSKGWHVPGNERVSLSTKHTLALTNRGTATSQDIVDLAVAVRNGVRDAFGVSLVPEPVWLGVAMPD